MSDDVYRISLAAVMGTLKDLNQAIDELRKPTCPHTELPPPKFFKFSEWVAWPRVNKSTNKVQWKEVRVDYIDDDQVVSRDNSLLVCEVEKLARKICLDCGWEPAKVLESVRTIQQAAEWCREQYQIRCRKAKEILEQQKDALEALAAEASMYKLE